MPKTFEKLHKNFKSIASFEISIEVKIFSIFLRNCTELSVILLYKKRYKLDQISFESAVVKEKLIRNFPFSN